jgi:hypothetical protein
VPTDELKRIARAYFAFELGVTDKDIGTRLVPSSPTLAPTTPEAADIRDLTDDPTRPYTA